MPQVSLQRPRIDAVIRKLVAAGVSQHVGVRLDAEIRDDRYPLDHAAESNGWRLAHLGHPQIFNHELESPFVRTMGSARWLVR